MKIKYLFTTALAALAVSCTQENLEAPVSTLNNRITIESPTITLSQGVKTRMTTGNAYAGVQWQPNDGFGAMLVDNVTNLGSNKWNEKYTITPAYKASNYLFAYEEVGGSAVFTTAAEMVEGNYIFYAPFNAAEDTRNSLTIKTPLTQEVKPSKRNSALTNFFEDKTSPVFIAYKDLHAGTAETELALEMYHIFGIPQVTLNNQYYTGAGTEEDPKVYHDLIVNKIELSNGSSKFVKEARLNNQKVYNELNKIAKAKSAWEEAAYEDAYTVDLYDDGAETTKKADKITINFTEGGLTVAKQDNQKFFIVLPAAKYDNLTATIYVTINGQEKKFSSAISPAQDFTLTAGLPYAAEEYNTDGSIKELTKGTSFAFTMEGTLTDVNTPAIPVDGIENVEQLVTYIQQVAYRGQDIQQVATEAEAKANPGTKFFIKDGKNVTINDTFINAVKNALIVNGQGTVTFMASDKVQLGDISQDYTLGNKIIYNATTLNSVGTLTAVVEGANLNVKSGTVTATADKTYTITNNGGTVIVPGEPAAGSTIKNISGTIKIQGNLKENAGNLTIDNCGHDDANDNKDKIGYVEVAANVTSMSQITNSTHGYIYNYGYLYKVANEGTIEMKSAEAGLADCTGTGSVKNNVLCPYVTYTTGDVTATLSTIPASIPANINTIYLNSNVTFAGSEFQSGKVFAAVTKVYVKAGKTITSGDMNQPAKNVTFAAYEKSTGNTTFTWTSGHPMKEVKVNDAGWAKKYTVNDVKAENVIF